MSQRLAVLLSEDLSLELRAAIQNLNHMGFVDSLQDSGLVTQRAEHLHERVDHMLLLIKQIGSIAERPRIQVAPPHFGETALQAFTEDLALERILLSRYGKRREQALALQMSDVQQLLLTRVEAVSESIGLLEKLLEASHQFTAPDNH